MSNSSTISELNSVIAIKKFRQDMDRNFSQLVEIESKIRGFNNRAIDRVFNTGSAMSIADWKAKLVKINDAIESVTHILENGKRKIESNDKSDNSEMWVKFDALMIQLEKELEDLPQMSVNMIPPSENIEWQKEMRDSEGVFLPMVVAYADACRVELLIREKYSAEELKKLNEFIQSKTPSDFSKEEAIHYEQDYKSAVAEFISEFDKDKNLWDRFLDILAGGTHQLPSERVMLERWIVGEKGDL